MSELLTTAVQNERNQERVAAWRGRYYRRLSIYPHGDIGRHRRLCMVDEFRRYYAGLKS